MTAQGGAQGGAPAAGASKDYFISRAGDDAPWARWIAWQLEAAGYSVVVQDWDFGPGTNFVSNMRDALDSARTTIAIYSPAYFASRYTEDEWTAALVRRDDGAIPLLPVRVAQVTLPRLLRPIVYVDLVGIDLATARQRLLGAVAGDKRSKPSEEPGFPGDEPAFPARPADRDDRAARVVNSAPIETPGSVTDAPSRHSCASSSAIARSGWSASLAGRGSARARSPAASSPPSAVTMKVPSPARPGSMPSST